MIMVKLTKKSTSGTSHFGVKLVTTPEMLTNLLGENTYGWNCGDDKVNMGWDCETKDGDVFTIYDYKTYKPLKMDDVVHWNIGGFSKETTEKGFIEITAMLSQKV